MLLGLALLNTLGCAADPCNTLCASVARRLDTCRAEWSATWEDLGATSRADLRQTCQSEWDITRGEIPTRQIPQAEDACEAATDDLSGASCDELRVLYLP